MATYDRERDSSDVLDDHAAHLIIVSDVIWLNHPFDLAVETL